MIMVWDLYNILLLQALILNVIEFSCFNDLLICDYTVNELFALKREVYPSWNYLSQFLVLLDDITATD